MRTAQGSQPFLVGGGSPGAGATDAELVSRAIEGDGDAATAIWSRYIVLVRTILRRGLGTNDVDDISQEVFINLYRSLSDLRDCRSLRSFVIGITLHIAGTELRRRRARAWLRLTPTGPLADYDVPVCADPKARAPSSRHYGFPAP